MIMICEASQRIKAFQLGPRNTHPLPPIEKEQRNLDQGAGVRAASFGGLELAAGEKACACVILGQGGPPPDPAGWEL
jgi:hypothetical protein